MKSRLLRGLIAALILMSWPHTSGQECFPEVLSPVVTGWTRDADLVEISGIAASRRYPGVLWVHNDGGRDRFFAITSSGDLIATFTIGRSVSDLEDIAMGPGPITGVDYLYLGDIGSNAESRQKVRVYRLAEPTLELSWTNDPPVIALSKTERFELTYPEEQSYNAETLMVDVTGDLFVGTKERYGTKIFRAAKAELLDGKTSALRQAAMVSFSLASGGSISRDGSLIILRHEEGAVLWRRKEGQSIGVAMESQWKWVPLVGLAEEPNGEAIDFTSDGSALVTMSEGASEAVRYYPLRRVGLEPKLLGAPQITREGVVLQVSACAGSRLVVEESVDLVHWKGTGSIEMIESEGSIVVEGDGGITFYRLRSD